MKRGLDQNFWESLVGLPAKRPRLFRSRHRNVHVRKSLSALPHETLCDVLSFMPCHDVAIARAASKRLKIAGDAVLDAALRRLLSRAEAQLALVSAAEQRAIDAGDTDQTLWLFRISWALAYVVQQLRLLHAVCRRYLPTWAETGDSCQRRCSFYGGLVLDTADHVLAGAAFCQQDRQLDLRPLHLGRLRRLTERWVQHFHTYVEPALLVQSGPDLPALPGCKTLDLLDCCAAVDRCFNIYWSQAGDWCWGRGRYVLLHTALRVSGASCQLLSQGGQRSLHACLARLASRSAHNASTHPRVLQDLFACHLIGSVKWSETASLEDQVPIMSLQRHAVFAEVGTWLEEEASDEELTDSSEDESEDPEEPDEDGEQHENEEHDGQLMEQQQMEAGEYEPDDGDGPQEPETVAVEVRFACRRHLAPLRVLSSEAPPLLRLDSSRHASVDDGCGPRQPDLQLRLTIHSPTAPAAGHYCCLIQQGGRLRPSSTGCCSWFRCGGREYLQLPTDGENNVSPEEDG